MNKKKILYLLRSKINKIDYKIIKLLSSRESISLDILRYKIFHKFNVRDKTREIELFKNLKKYSEINKIDPLFIEQLFNLIVKNSIKIQEFNKKKIILNQKEYHCAYLGPIGSYSYIAYNSFIKKHKKNFLANEYPNFSSIIHAINNNDCQFALLPLENSISGIIPEVYDILKEQDKIYIIGETYLKIQHQLLSIKKCFFCDIENIYSHTQPFKQCSIFLEKFPEWKKHYFNSTSEAMKRLSLERKKNTVVIGNSIGGSFYNLKKIAINLSNKKNNVTRFILISKKQKKNLNNVSTKITMLLKISDSKKNHQEILKIFKNMNINLIKMIHQKYEKNKKNKIYFTEIQGNIFSQIIKDTLHRIKKYAEKIKILGCYAIEKYNNPLNKIEE
ncbi:prephenate dehydratase domain-containing protein [Buchnera aphidicola]|uniref:Bifunctional chorismate mutase/prephenate dehydratase n=1 Tax=Buchnera aphidicola (Cinara strobi) TaxID=1921549 RepID=A0A3B1E9J5_9GAMM|nr:prephenate dehydratase domain-containing protein [Buchnera aphidicola]VAX76649.1 P-protein [Buchnera aphidicola (Cinara strobi)]